VYKIGVMPNQTIWPNFKILQIAIIVALYYHYENK